MCLVNELARFNKIQPEYKLLSEQGPAHSKVNIATFSPMFVLQGGDPSLSQRHCKALLRHNEYGVDTSILNVAEFVLLLTAGLQKV